MESNGLGLGLGLKEVERGPCTGRWQLEGVVTVEGRKNPGEGVRDACWVGMQVPCRCDVEGGVLRAGPPADVQDSLWS